MDKTVLISLPVEDLQTLIIDSVNTCLKYHKSEPKESKKDDDFLNADQASQLLKIAKPTLYSLVSTRKIASYKRGKKLYFKKTELEQWINSGKRSSVSELAEKAKQRTAA